MTLSEYTYLLKNPHKISKQETIALEEINNDYPYFQSAKALLLKALYDENSIKYNALLKITAAHTTDRTALFNFIVSENFIGIKIPKEKTGTVYEIPAFKPIESQITENNENFLEKDSETKKFQIIKNPPKGFLFGLAGESSSIDDPENRDVLLSIKLFEERLKINSPLVFSKKETHSFEEFMQIEQPNSIEQENFSSLQKKKKIEIIDKFIDNNPKISRLKPGELPAPSVIFAEEDTTTLTTETLARVYLEQKKYQKAIMAYEILMLKNPEKSSYFAARISDIKELYNLHNNK